MEFPSIMKTIMNDPKCTISSVFPGKEKDFQSKHVQQIAPSPLTSETSIFLFSRR